MQFSWSAWVLNYEKRRPRVPQPSLVRSSGKGGQGALCIQGKGWWAVGGPSTHGDKRWRGKEGKKPGLGAQNSFSVPIQGCCCSVAQESVWCRSILQGSISQAVGCTCFLRVWSLFFEYYILISLIILKKSLLSESHGTLNISMQHVYFQWGCYADKNSAGVWKEESAERVNALIPWSKFYIQKNLLHCSQYIFLL